MTKVFEAVEIIYGVLVGVAVVGYIAISFYP